MLYATPRNGRLQCPGHSVYLKDAARAATAPGPCRSPAYALKALLNHNGGADVTGGYLVITTERLRPPMEKIEDFVLKAAKVRWSAEVVALARAL